MKLTNYVRDAIYRRILDDIPRVDHAKLRKEMQEDLCRGMSPLARQLFNESPRALRVETIYNTLAGYGFTLVVGDADSKEVLAPYYAEEKKQTEVKSRLQGALRGCSTTNQLRELLPEFAKYFPDEKAPSKNLPAVAGLAKDLQELGWPKK